MRPLFVRGAVSWSKPDANRTQEADWASTVHESAKAEARTVGWTVRCQKRQETQLVSAEKALIRRGRGRGETLRVVVEARTVCATNATRRGAVLATAVRRTRIAVSDIAHDERLVGEGSRVASPRTILETGDVRAEVRKRRVVRVTTRRNTHGSGGRVDRVDLQRSRRNRRCRRRGVVGCWRLLWRFRAKRRSERSARRVVN